MRVGISHDFFAKGLQDYEDWKWAWVREVAQNSIDCGANTITISVESHDGDTLVTAENDGPPMSEETLLTKFLCLGGTTKTFEDSVGGFGIAKTVICLAHKSYRIETGDNLIEGSGGEFELSKIPFFSGTRTTVVMEGDQVEALVDNFEKFAFWVQWSGDLWVNGKLLETRHRKGSPRRDLGFGKVYSNRSRKYRLCVRIGGVPMFVQSTGFDRTVIVELKGASNDVLTANRDGLVNPYRNELSDFVTELSVDKSSALKNRRRGPKYKQYRGTKLCHQRSLDVVDLVKEPVKEHPGYPNGIDKRGPGPVIEEAPQPGIDLVDGDEPQDPLYHMVQESDRPVRAAAYAVAEHVAPRREVATLGHNFVVKNETDLKVPAYYDPGSGEFSQHSTKLARFWGRIMLEMHRLFDVEDEFSIGFVFSEDDAAQHEQGNYGRVYYLNPCKIVEQKASYSKSFKKRWKLTDRDDLIMIGLHEMVHGLGISWHDERYANRLTDMAAKVMKNRRRFNWCFK